MLQGLWKFFKRLLAFFLSLYYWLSGRLSSPRGVPASSEAAESGGMATADSASASRQSVLTYQEAYEKSWNFVNEICAHIDQKFSKGDREAVHALGRRLFEGGFRYVHSVTFRQDVSAKRGNAAPTKAPKSSEESVGR
jgi:acetate kinase